MRELTTSNESNKEEENLKFYTNISIQSIHTNVSYFSSFTNSASFLQNSPRSSIINTYLSQEKEINEQEINEQLNQSPEEQFQYNNELQNNDNLEKVVEDQKKFVSKNQQVKRKKVFSDFISICHTKNLSDMENSKKTKNSLYNRLANYLPAYDIKTINSCYYSKYGIDKTRSKTYVKNAISAYDPDYLKKTNLEIQNVNLNNSTDSFSSLNKKKKKNNYKKAYLLNNDSYIKEKNFEVHHMRLDSSLEDATHLSVLNPQIHKKLHNILENEQKIEIIEYFEKTDYKYHSIRVNGVGTVIKDSIYYIKKLKTSNIEEIKKELSIIKNDLIKEIDKDFEEVSNAVTESLSHNKSFIEKVLNGKQKIGEAEQVVNM